jgi:NAD(P)-dependent dehydrogenase (short-subunit alcohol dehydrogenase family)
MNSVLRQFDIAGRSAIVTGGGCGLGFAIGEALSAAGAHVTVIDCEAQSGARAAEKLGGRFELADISDRAALGRAFARHVEAFGGLDILFANAGVGGGPGVERLEGGYDPTRAMDAFPADEWDKVVGINLTGTFNTLRYGAKAMKMTGKGGSIVVTTSNAAILNELVVGLAYLPAKAGAAHLARQAALELAPHKIRVNAMAPGPFVTNIANGRMHILEIRRGWQRRVPLGEIADPECIKPLALFLASDASRYVTGAQIVIDGGMSLGAESSCAPLS